MGAKRGKRLGITQRCQPLLNYPQQQLSKLQKIQEVRVLSSRCRVACCVVPLAVLVWLSCGTQNDPRISREVGATPLQQTRERCPNEPYRVRDDWRHRTDEILIPLARATQNIPEYHDCQRLLTPQQTYGPLVGVWARDSIDQLTAGDFRGEPIAVAELLNFSDSVYAPLGIGRGYSCLYMVQQSTGWVAFMVNMGPDANCPRGRDAANRSPTRLEVKVQPASKDSAPPAARWDMDPQNKVQYIGIWCPDGWCEIGASGFSQSAVYSGRRKEERVKGWYDEQYLAVIDANGKLRPSSIKGRTIPASRLDTLDLTHFTCTGCTKDDWVPVATVIIESDSAGYYLNKLNLLKDGPSQISIRHNASVPGGRWEALITNVQRHSVGRRMIWIDHRNMRVPGTSRWHFMGNDETVWMRCSYGCCDVLGLS